MKNIQTLHSHTVNSDGALTHLESLKTCAKNNISVVAFTDHDNVIDKKTLAQLRSYSGPTKWISGIEISSGLPKELGGKATSMFHIVGLFVDPTNSALKDYCSKAAAGRVQRMQKLVSNLNDLGFDVTEQDCLDFSGGESVGRPHIVKAIMSKPKNVVRIDELAVQMKKDAQNSKELQKKYDSMISQDKQKYPYTLFLTPESYVDGVYVDYLYSLDLDESVSLIRNAGGVAFLAHYFTSYHKVTPMLLDKIFEQNRLDGAETVFGLFSLNTKGVVQEKIEESKDLVKALVNKHNKLQSGGADAHTKQDLVSFANSGDYAMQTHNFAQKIIESSDVDVFWSSF